MIHHYTSIEALRCIVKSKKLRFTRLDKFDDVLEAQSRAGINFGEQFFASCWVREKAEDIPQWKIYGDGMRGVRISLPAEPFNSHLLDQHFPVPGTTLNWHFDRVLAPYPIQDVIGDGYILFPTAFVGGAGAFLRDVVYVPDVADVYRQKVREVGGVVTIEGAPCDLAYFKSDIWRFQKECRFVLQAFEGVAGGASNSAFGDEYRAMLQRSSLFSKGPTCHHIFINLSAKALREMKVTIGPLCPSRESDDLSKFLASFAPGATIIQSEFTGKVR